MKKIISLLISLSMCFFVIGIVPALAETTSKNGNAYTIYTTENGAAATSATTLNRYYEGMYYWKGATDGFSTASNRATTYALGYYSNNNYAPLLRFPLPIFNENEEISSAKIVTTITNVSEMSADLEIQACTTFTSTALGTQLKPSGITPPAFDKVAGKQTVSKLTAKAGDKIEINVTEYVKNLAVGTKSADFLLAIAGLSAQNYIEVKRATTTDFENAPVLVITTKSNEDVAKITSQDATGVPVNDYIAEIKFDRAMNPDTLTLKNITVSPHNIPVERVNFSPDYTSVKIAMGSNLLYNTEYAVSFSESVLAADGKQLEDGATFKFATVSSNSGDNDPELSSSFPENGAKNVKAINSVSLEFDKEMYIPQITANDFELTKVGGTAPEISSVSVHNDGKQIFVYFEDVLEYGADYTLNIDGLYDLDGNEFSGSISFATAKATVVIKETEEYTAETKSEVKTLYTTATGEEKASEDKIEDVYETSTYWQGDAVAAESQNNEANNILPVGADSNGTRYWGSALRFKLPALQENELVTGAKLVFTVKSAAEHTGDICVNAYTGCLDGISHGESIAKFGKTYAEVTAGEVAGGISIPASSIVDDQKLEIEVTDYIKSITSSATSADFVIAAPDMTSANLVKLYSGHYSRVSYRPQLVLTTIPDSTAIGTTDVTLENVTDSEQKVTLIAALYTSDEIFKTCIVKPDVPVGTGANKTVQVRINKFTDRNATDVIRVFGVESLKNLVPLHNSYIGVVDAQFYPGYTRKAVTLSYDDGPSTDDVTLLQKLNEKGVRATINNVADRIKAGTAMQLAFDTALFAGNHEMANHSYSHGTNLGNRETVKEACAQMADGENTLEYYYGTDIRGVAYPYGKPSKWFNDITQYLLNRQNLYARCSTNGNFDVPEDFMEWDFTCHHDYLYSEAKDYANKFFNLLPDDGTLKVLSVWGHPYNFEPVVDDTTGEVTRAETWSTILEPFASTISEKAKTKEIWNPTNIELVEYVNAVNALVINEDCIYNPSNVDVYVKINGAKVVVPAGGTVY